MTSSEVLVLANKRRRIVRRAQSRYMSKRQNLSPETGASLILECLKSGSLVRYKLSNKIKLFGSAFDSAIEYAIAAGWVKVSRRSGKLDGGGPPTTVYTIS